MGGIKVITEDSEPKSWLGLGVRLAIAAVATTAVGYLWKFYKHRQITDEYSSLPRSGLNDSQQLSTFTPSSSRPVTPAHIQRPNDTGPNPTQHALPGTPQHVNREHDRRSEVISRERGMVFSDNQSLLNLLYNMADEQSRKESYVHRSISCNVCKASPICGNRYKCASCMDYDICEMCEAQDRHNRTHNFIKIKIPIALLANPRNVLIKPFYPGKELHRRRPTLDEMQHLRSTTYFDQHEIEALFDQYRTLCTKDRGITRDVYDICLGPLGLETNLVMDRLFKFYDANGDGYIDFEEFVRGLSILIKGTQEEKVRYAFEGYDLDGIGCVSRDNLRKMFKAYFYITIELVRDVVKACEEEMMANFDDTQGRPVSSLFSAPIPTDTGSDPSKITKTPFSGNPGSREDMWPVMEAMSQDAIEEMVENIFKTANVDLDQRITLQQFSELTALDSSLLAWFDALGTVF